MIYSKQQLDPVIERLKKEVADYYQRPEAYHYEFHTCWLQKLHALGSALVVFEGALAQGWTLNKAQTDSLFYTALGHWTSFGSVLWQPPRELQSADWDALVLIAQEMGIRGMPAYRARHA